jgi:hypothetical protein
MAASIFNFLRMENWQRFCKSQKQRKLRLKKTLSASAKHCKKARQGYNKLFVLAPEIWMERPLAGGEPLPLSDVLEREAYFLAAQATMEQLRAELVFIHGQKPSHSKARRVRVARALTETSTALKLLANSYRSLRNLDSYVPFDYPVGALTASQLVGVLQAEQEKSTGVLARVDTAFNTKRFGIAANLAILVRLQHFVEEFQFRSESYMPETAARQASDLAPAFALAKYHMKVRQFLAPNPGENPDARCAHKILTWLIEHVPNGRWVSLRDLMKAIHYERFGPWSLLSRAAKFPDVR